MTRLPGLTLSIAAAVAAVDPAAGQPVDELRALLAERAQTATELANIEIERGAIEMQATQMIIRGNGITADSEVLGNEVDQFNSRCERSFDLPAENGAYNGCLTWRSGLDQRLNILVQNGQELDRDIQALRSRDGARVERGTQLLRAMARNLARLQTICAQLPDSARSAHCPSGSYDSRIRPMMTELTRLASHLTDECLAYTNLESMAECARVPFDTTTFHPLRRSEIVPEGYFVSRNN